MEILNINDYSIKNLGKINILLGKNGCGKSTLMRKIESRLVSNQAYGNIKYISPERGGVLQYDPNVENNISKNGNWILNERRKNQSVSFKHQTIIRYKNLELEVLRRYEKDTSNPTFDSIIKEINSLLENIQIKREGTTFKVYNNSETEIETTVISSGESELISLAIECLLFYENSSDTLPNILFIDEPDVHIHPDLQLRFMQFLNNIVDKEKEIYVIIATHSTAILGAYEQINDMHVTFMLPEMKELIFTPINDVYKKILPIFGAHPLSNIFNSNPILILEGEDDVRVWQQVVRSSEGNVKVYPCSAGSKSELDAMEDESIKLISTIYDNAKGFSIRDRDDSEGTIEDKVPIIRLILDCRNIENLILSDESLSKLGLNWDQMKGNITDWLKTQGSLGSDKKHQSYDTLRNFSENGFLRKTFDLKKIRNDLLHLANTNKPWEVLVGQAIAENIEQAESHVAIEGSIYNFLGEKIVKNILLNE